MDSDQLLPAEPHRVRHHDGHLQLHTLLHLHEGQVDSRAPPPCMYLRAQISRANVKGVDIRAGAVQAEQLRGAAECVPQRLHPPRHQPGPQEGDATM